MAETGSSLNSPTHPLSLPRGPPIGNVLSRQDTASSAGSDQYLPMPPGHWLLDIHGSCPKCHHRHSAVNIRVDVSQDRKRVSRVKCENCQQNWLAFGGRNSTRISLLSTTTTSPDAVEKEVRSALVNMIKYATAIASPALTDIPEKLPYIQSEEPPVPLHVDSSFQPTVHSTSTPGRVSFRIPVSRLSRDPHSPSSTAQSPRSAFSMLRKSRLKRLLKSSKQRGMSAKAMGKRPIDVPDAPSEPSPFANTRQIQPNHNKRPAPSKLQFMNSSVRSEEASRFLAQAENDVPNTTDKKALVAWARSKVAQFKDGRVKSPTTTSSIVNASTQANHAEMSTAPSIRTTYRRSLDLLGLGSHLGHSDRWWERASSHSPRTGSVSISEWASGATTAVNDDTIVSPGTRNSWSELVQWERRGSGSPRPSSAQRARCSWQQFRQPHTEARYSVDSTLFGRAMISSTGVGH